VTAHGAVTGHAGPSRRLPFRGAEEPRSRPALLGSEVLALFVVPTALLAQFGAAVLVTAPANRRRGVRELLSNLWEEAGWMGFVQARLQNRHGALVALILGRSTPACPGRRPT
jgi:hypothetical protein